MLRLLLAVLVRWDTIEDCLIEVSPGSWKVDAGSPVVWVTSIFAIKRFPTSRIANVVGLDYRLSDFGETASEQSTPHPRTLPNRPRSSSDQIQELGAHTLRIGKPSLRELSRRERRLRRLKPERKEFLNTSSCSAYLNNSFLSCQMLSSSTLSFVLDSLILPSERMVSVKKARNTHSLTLSGRVVAASTKVTPGWGWRRWGRAS